MLLVTLLLHYLLHSITALIASTACGLATLEAAYPGIAMHLLLFKRTQKPMDMYTLKDEP